MINILILIHTTLTKNYSKNIMLLLYFLYLGLSIANIMRIHILLSFYESFFLK